MLAVLAPAAAALRRHRRGPESVPAGSAAVLDADAELADSAFLWAAGSGASEADGVSDAGRPGARDVGVVERLARLGERGVAAARAWPGPVTALVAGVCAAGSYGHAETGRAGSVLAAVVEATAVVVFARVFGPALGLRAGPPSDGASSAGASSDGWPLTG
jgi:hypothetical protein